MNLKDEHEKIMKECFSTSPFYVIRRNVYELKNELEYSDMFLLFILSTCDNIESYNSCKLPNKTLAEKLDVSEESVAQGISRLHKVGLIESISFDGETRYIKISGRGRP